MVVQTKPQNEETTMLNTTDRAYPVVTHTHYM